MPAKTAHAGLYYLESGCKHSVRNRFFMGEAKMRYWLLKSEPDEVSMDDVLAAPKKTVAWFGVRNYQAEHMCVFGEKWTSFCCCGA